MSSTTLEEVNVTEVIRPNAFWVTPIRRNPPSEEIAQILRIEKELPGLVNAQDLKVTLHNISKLAENAIIAVKVQTVIPSSRMNYQLYKGPGFWIKSILVHPPFRKKTRITFDQFLPKINWKLGKNV
jgi:hypothetical protein